LALSCGVKKLNIKIAVSRLIGLNGDRLSIAP
jgi:hypothetical protein